MEQSRAEAENRPRGGNSAVPCSGKGCPVLFPDLRYRLLKILSVLGLDCFPVDTDSAGTFLSLFSLCLTLHCTLMSPRIRS